MYGVQAKGFAGLTISRTHGIQQRLPITLPASLHAPSPSGTCHIQTRLARMVKLYRCIDGTFIDLWNGVRCQADPSWVHELQMSLHELTPNRIGCTEGQAAEIVVARSGNCALLEGSWAASPMSRCYSFQRAALPRTSSSPWWDCRTLPCRLAVVIW
jgi:hypothetical protein